MGKSQQYNKLKHALDYQEGKSTYWKDLLLSKRFWVKSSIMAGPVVVMGSVFTTIFQVDDWIHNNRNQVKEIELNQSQYMASILDMSNPWNITNPDDPITFLMSFFIGADADILKRLEQVTAQLDQDKLLFLTNLLRMVEMSDEQRDRFIVLISTLLKSETSLKQLPILVDMLQRIEQADKKFQKLAKEEQEASGEEVLVAGNVVAGIAIEKAQTHEEALNYSLLELITTDKPQALSFLLETMLTLDPAVYDQLMSVVGTLGGVRAEKLLDLLEDLNSGQVSDLVGLLEEVNTQTTRKIVDRLDAIPTSLIADVIEFTDSISAGSVEAVFDLTESYSQDDFGTFIDLHQNVSDVDAAVSIYETLSSSTAKKLVLNILVEYESAPGDLNLVIQELSSLPGQTQKNFVEAFESVDSQALSDIPEVLKKLNSNTAKQRLIDEATELTTENRENMLEMLTDIDSTSAVKVLDISTNLSSQRSKNQLADQGYRIYKYNGGGADAETRSISGYDAPTSLYNDNGEEVIEEFVDQLYEINDRDLNADILEESSDLSTSIYRGAEVVSAIDVDAADLLKPGAPGSSKSWYSWQNEN